jgi:hypothetical protein
MVATTDRFSPLMLPLGLDHAELMFRTGKTTCVLGRLNRKGHRGYGNRISEMDEIPEHG